MADLTEAQKAFIVVRLARFDRPSEVRKEFAEVHGTDVTLQQLARYNPENASAFQLAQKWHDLFEATRRAFVAEVSEVPIAIKAFRLRRLQRLLDRAERMGNLDLAAAVLEQAAKEMGGVYTNRHALDLTPDSDAGPHPVPVTLGGRYVGAWQDGEAEYEWRIGLEDGGVVLDGVLAGEAGGGGGHHGCWGLWRSGRSPRGLVICCTIIIR